MGPADGFSKPRTRQPAPKSAAPRFTSAFDAPAPPTTRVKPPSKSSFDNILPVRFVDSEAQVAEPRKKAAVPEPPKPPLMRALKPPIPLFNSAPPKPKPPAPAVAQRPPPPPPLPSFPPPISKTAALRHLAPPAPPAPTPSSSKLKAPTAPLKPLVPPLPPAPATPSSDRALRTISTTLLARATDLFTDSGASELASIFLHDQHPDVQQSQFPGPDDVDGGDVDGRRGIMMSPEKGGGNGKGKGKFVRNGLAARAAALYDRAHSSLALWEAEMAHALASSRRGLNNPDMRLRILHILHPPAPVAHPSSKLSTPGVTLCLLLAAPAAAESAGPGAGALVFPTKDSIYAVLLSFSSLSPPPALRQAQPQLAIRNPEDFAEGREVYVWKPWQLLAIEPAALRRCLQTDSEDVAPPKQEQESSSSSQAVFDYFDSGGGGAALTRVRAQDAIAETALVCERFVVLK
ncbi:hypothetical protein C8R46DRAFT_1037365 [Mycena filopes]|nr:hypothetical protein C8R46DRAFT_1037365 [Mycena filopes]